MNARINMIKQQLRTGDIHDETILALYNDIPRESFVPEPWQHFAYSDVQIALPQHQRMMTPLEEATLLQALALQGHETILEVGTGTGFLTALLSRLCKRVISVDCYPEFTNNARQKLEAYHCKNIELLTGDASHGWLEKAPYDVVLFTGAIDSLDETRRLQVLPGGKLFAIVGQAPIMRAQLCYLDHEEQWHERLIFETHLPPLIDKLHANDFIF